MGKKDWIEFHNQERPYLEKQQDDLPQKISKIIISKQKKGKKGKIITSVRGLGLKNGSQVRALLKKMKVYCGTGGTLIDDQDIQLQGDMIIKSIEFLRKEGFQI